MAARQVHGKGGPVRRGAHCGFTTVRLGNFADDEKSQPEAALPLLSGSARERIEDLIQGRRLDGRPAVRDFEPDIGRLTDNDHPDWGVRRPITVLPVRAVGRLRSSRCC